VNKHSTVALTIFYAAGQLSVAIGSCTAELFKPSEDAGRHVVQIFKKLERLWFVFFVGDVIMRAGLHILGRRQRALGANPNKSFFDSSFYWKLGYDTSLQSP